jgi:hypothetical protein
MLQPHLNKRTFRSNRTELRYPKGAIRPNANRTLSVCLLVLVLLTATLLFQEPLILKNESEDVITVDKNVVVVASAAAVVITKTDNLTPHVSQNSESSAKETEQDLHQVEVKKENDRASKVLVEPRLPTADFSYAGLFTLVSVTTYVAYSCVVLQTSSCSVLPVKDGEDPEPMSRQIEEVAKQTYHRALPMCRGMLERGLVRITILDRSIYKLTDGTNYYTPSNAWMSVNYWKDEFIEKVDNEMILIVQSDSVICRESDILLWSDLSGLNWVMLRRHPINPHLTLISKNSGPSLLRFQSSPALDHSTVSNR